MKPNISRCLNNLESYRLEYTPGNVERFSAPPKPLFRKGTFRQDHSNLVRRESHRLVRNEGEPPNEERELAILFSTPKFLSHFLTLIEPIWYLTSVKKAYVTNLLQSAAPGNFIVSTKSTSSLSNPRLSLKGSDSRVQHHQMSQSATGEISVSSYRTVFPSMIDLLAHFIIKENLSGTMLTIPRILISMKPHELKEIAEMREEFWLKMTTLLGEARRRSCFQESSAEDEETILEMRPQSQSARLNPSGHDTTAFSLHRHFSTRRQALFLHREVKTELTSFERCEESDIDSDFEEGIQPFPCRTKSIYSTNEKHYVKVRVKSLLKEHLSDTEQCFGKSLSVFVQCTKEGQTNDPDKVMNNIRQFLTAQKKFLKSFSYKDWGLILEQHGLNVLAVEMPHFFDSIYENVLNEFILRPLKPMLMDMLMTRAHRLGKHNKLKQSLTHCQQLSAQDFGLKATLSPPSQADLLEVSYYFDKFMSAYSPIKKMEYFIRANQVISNHIQDTRNGQFVSPIHLGADEMTPALLYCISQCCSAEMGLHAFYCDGLLSRDLRTGQAEYYLITLNAAMEFIVHQAALTECSPSDSSSMGRQSVCLMLTVILDADEGSDVCWKTMLAIEPQQTAGDLCREIQQKYGLSNTVAREYGLFAIHGSLCEQLLPEESPQLLKSKYAFELGVLCDFVFKKSSNSFTTHVRREQ